MRPNTVDPSTPKMQRSGSRIRQPLNQLLQGADVLLIKGDDPKLIYTVRSKSSSTFVRPNTMSGSRSKRLLQPENSRPQTSGLKVKYETAQKTTRDLNQFDRDARTNKKTLKQVIGKITLLKQGSEACTSNPIDLIFTLLSCLSKTQNFYRQIFQYVEAKLRSQTIFNKNQTSCQTLKTIIDRTNNPQLIRALYSNDKMVVTYKQIFNEVCQEMSKSMKMADIEKQNYEQYIAQLNRTIQQKKQTIRKMKETVKYYSFHPSQDLYPYIEQLEQTINNMKSENGMLQQMHKETQTNLEIMKSTNAILADKIEQFKARIYELELSQFSRTTEVQKNSEMIEFESHVTTLKSMLDKSLIRMVGMKEQFDKLKQQNQNLINQRSQLAKRAAVGFSQLTPRPNLKKIFTQNGLDFTKIFKSTDRKVSTQNFVKVIVGRFKQTFQHMKQLQLGSKIVYDSNGNPINKIKAQPGEVMQELKKNKEKLRQTETAAFNVKNKYQKQIEEKKKLQQKAGRQ